MYAFVRKHGCGSVALLEPVDTDFRKGTKAENNNEYYRL